MIALIIVAVLITLGLVVFALVRGLHAFAHMRPTELDENGVPKSAAIQNKMMFARVKWQAITILLIAILLVLSQAGR